MSIFNDEKENFKASQKLGQEKCGNIAFWKQKYERFLEELDNANVYIEREESRAENNSEQFSKQTRKTNMSSATSQRPAIVKKLNKVERPAPIEWFFIVFTNQKSRFAHFFSTETVLSHFHELH